MAEVRRQFLAAWTGERDPGAATLSRTLDPIHQRTLRIWRDADGRRRVNPVGDPPLPAEDLDRELPTERYEAVLPEGPVAIGDTWEVSGERLQRALGPGLGENPEGSLAATLREVRNLALDEDTPAEDYAVLALEVSAAGTQGTEEDAPRLEVRMSGELLFSLARGQVAAVSLRGTARLRQTRREGDAVLEVNGEGPVEVKKRFWFPARPKGR